MEVIIGFAVIGFVVLGLWLMVKAIDYVDNWLDRKDPE